MQPPICLFTGQWADLPLAELAPLAREMGYDGLELATWGDHFEVQRALREDDYCTGLWELLASHGLSAFALSAHLVGQAICDPVDARHRAILPERIWADGDPEGVRRRAARELCDTARAARRFFDVAPPRVREHIAWTGRTVVNGFTGSPIWHLLYSFPPAGRERIEAGFREFGERFAPILSAFEEVDVCFALEVHPTEIAFDLKSAARALTAVGDHPRFGFNLDPSHFCYQGVDVVGFVRRFGSRVFNVHVKDVWWSDRPTEAGVFGGHTEFGEEGRFWDFRSPGRGRVDFEALWRALVQADYRGPLTVEWEDPMMDRVHGAREAQAFTRRLRFPRSARAFDEAFDREEQPE